MMTHVACSIACFPSPTRPLGPCSAQSQNLYVGDFGLAYSGYFNGQVEVTTWGQDSHFSQWHCYVGPLGMDPYLKDTLSAKGSKHSQDSW